MKATFYRGIKITVERKAGGGYICTAEYKKYTMIGFSSNSLIYDNLSEDCSKKRQNEASREAYNVARGGRKEKNWWN